MVEIGKECSPVDANRSQLLQEDSLTAAGNMESLAIRGVLVNRKAAWHVHREARPLLQHLRRPQVGLEGDNETTFRTLAQAKQVLNRLDNNWSRWPTGG